MNNTSKIPCEVHKNNNRIPFSLETWLHMERIFSSDPYPLCEGCTEGCREYMIEQYKNIIKLVRLAIKYYKYQIISPHPGEQFNYLNLMEFIMYYFSGEDPDDKRIESHLTVKMVEGKLVQKSELSDSEDDDQE
ncbi:hypothetical protein DLAC_09267 [Tieghemostelium lacteum]|uniref:Uncharacterized protein n=1 Tax=Tieghemostelium lacteum TaxID=361077 RepID=A0A151Z9L5_TIELA|nr:hypothetical protein DLAC_09267 [Tieghemostelium lacteum]|eukprot:KYQ90636.1 hypothetical protein DLAC_09267 [Tieghemostelium lacteum]